MDVKSEIYTQVVNQRMFPELPGISCRFSAEGLGRNLRRGLKLAGPGRGVLIPSMPFIAVVHRSADSRL